MAQGLIQLGIGRNARREAWRKCALASAAVSSLFSLLVAIVLTGAFFREAKENPLQTPRLTELKTQLAASPENEGIKEQIRAIDQDVRLDYFARRRFVRTGTLLLVSGLLVLVASLMAAAELSAQPYMPTTDLMGNAPKQPTGAMSRQALLIGAGAVALIWVASAAVYRPDPVPLSSSAVAPAPHPGDAPIVKRLAEAPVTKEEYERNWPALRGPYGAGITTGHFRVQWDADAAKNIAWKVPLSLPGNNSPVVWEDRLFLSGADENNREIYCFDVASGELEWKHPFPTSATRPKVMEDTGYACSTLATDGRRVYAIFPAGDIIALDFDGKRLWTKSLGIPINPYGHASSLLTYRNRLLVQFDQSKGERGTGKSFLYCLDGPTGNALWQVEREVEASWATPLLARTAAGPQLILLASPYHAAYDPENGREIWRLAKTSGEMASSPALAGDKAITIDHYHGISAVKPDGAGDITQSHVAWKYEDEAPDIVSPVSDGRYVYIILSGGSVICCDAADGKELWREELDVQCSPSPIVVGRHIYLLDMKGTMHVLESGPAFKPVAKWEIGEAAVATPAFAAGRIFVRAKENLYCVAPPPAPAETQPATASSTREAP